MAAANRYRVKPALEFLINELIAGMKKKRQKYAVIYQYCLKRIGNAEVTIALPLT